MCRRSSHATHPCVLAYGRDASAFLASLRPGHDVTVAAFARTVLTLSHDGPLRRLHRANGPQHSGTRSTTAGAASDPPCKTRRPLAASEASPCDATETAGTVSEPPQAAIASHLLVLMRAGAHGHSALALNPAFPGESHDGPSNWQSQRLPGYRSSRCSLLAELRHADDFMCADRQRARPQPGSLF